MLKEAWQGLGCCWFLLVIALRESRSILFHYRNKSTTEQQYCQILKNALQHAKEEM